MSKSLLIALMVFSFCSLAFAQDFSKVEIKAHPLADNIYMLTGSGGNIGLFTGAEGTFMIDDQYGPLSEKIQKAIAEISDQPVRYLINTHWHGDHSGGNENFAKTGTVIVAHENVRKRMSTEQMIGAFSRKVPPSPDGALPVITFSDNVKLHLNGEDILVMHLHNGHTDGDAIVYFNHSNVLHTGDLYFNGMYPFIDVSTGGTIDGIIKAANQLIFLADDDTRIIPGHGPASNKAELIAYRDMLQAVRDRVKKGIAMGKDVEAIMADNPVQGLDEKWGQGFMNAERFVSIIFSDLYR